MPSKSYEGANLYHRSFRNQELDRAQLHDADLTGADFTGADLHDADLRGVHTGMTTRWKLLVIAAGLAVSIFVGVIAGVAGRVVVAWLESESFRETIGGVVLTTMLVVFVVAAVWRGYWYAAKHTLPVLAAVLVLSAGYLLVRGLGTGQVTLQTLGLLVILAVAVGLGGVARALAGTGGQVGFVIAAVTGAVVGAVLGGGLLAAVVAIGAVIIGQLSLRKKEGLGAVERIVYAFSARGGTRFRDADLRGAQLDGAELYACDFRGAKLDEHALDRAKSVRLCIFDAPRPAASRG